MDLGLNLKFFSRQCLAALIFACFFATFDKGLLSNHLYERF